MNFDYNFENADYLTTLDSIRSNLYKVTANINLEIFSLNKAIREKNDPSLVTRKEKLEACLASIIELTDSLANNFVEVDKLIGGNQTEEEKVNPLIEEARKYNSEILSEVIKKTQESVSKHEKEKEMVEETEEVEAPTGVKVDSIEEEETPQEEVVEAPQEEVVEETTDEIKIPEETETEDEGEVVTNAIEPPIEATKEDAVETSPEPAVEAAQEDVVEEQVEAAPEPVSGESVYVANKIDTGVSKAILVTDDQYRKLEASRDSQIALCKFRDLLVGKEVVEEKNDLESLMEKANQLYQDGNIEEAEKLYNKISELSKNGTA